METKLEEKSTSRYENGQILVEAIYMDGKLEGEYKSYYENGRLWEQKFYRNGVENGEYKQWHDNGQIKEQVTYQNGKLEGEHKVWFKNGQLHWRLFYQNGVLEGEYKSWYDNGCRLEHVFYQNGKMRGKFRHWNCKYWDEDGYLEQQVFFGDRGGFHGGFEGECKLWHKNGTIKLYEYHINNSAFDPEFTNKKRNILLKLKRKLYFNCHTISDRFLINDLTEYCLLL
jgi:antitoxin component YwqK of YwqJK toxin-antitoxin module